MALQYNITVGSESVAGGKTRFRVQFLDTGVEIGAEQAFEVDGVDPNSIYDALDAAVTALDALTGEPSDPTLTTGSNIVKGSHL